MSDKPIATNALTPEEWRRGFAQCDPQSRLMSTAAYEWWHTYWRELWATLESLNAEVERLQSRVDELEVYDTGLADEMRGRRC